MSCPPTTNAAGGSKSAARNPGRAVTMPVGGTRVRARAASPRAVVLPTPPNAPINHSPTRRSDIARKPRGGSGRGPAATGGGGGAGRGGGGVYLDSGRPGGGGQGAAFGWAAVVIGPPPSIPTTAGTIVNRSRSRRSRLTAHQNAHPRTGTLTWTTTGETIV